MTSLGAFAAGAAVLIFYGQIGPSQETYLEAETAFEKWSATPEDADLFKNMQVSLRKVPELGAKYNAVIAQTLLDRSKGGAGAGEAIELALKSMGQIEHEAPFHAAYASNSLCIEKGEYQEALQQAVMLKEQMGKSCDIERFKEESMAGGRVLYVYNLIRIACLQQKLSNRSGEKAAWDELDEFLPNSQSILSCFLEKGVALDDYIAERKKASQAK